MEQICNPNDIQSLLQKPFLLEVPDADGPQTFTVATDGHVLLARRGRDDRWTHENETISSMVLKLLTEPRLESGIEIDTADLALWAGTAQFSTDCPSCHGGGVRCPDCDGEGEMCCECMCGHEHEAYCDRCNGDGFLRCPKCGCNGIESRVPVRMGTLSGTPINRDLLARALSFVSGRAHLYARDLETVRIEGEGWIILIMPRHVSFQAKGNAINEYFSRHGVASEARQ